VSLWDADGGDKDRSRARHHFRLRGSYSFFRNRERGPQAKDLWSRIVKGLADRIR